MLIATLLGKKRRYPQKTVLTASQWGRFFLDLNLTLELSSAKVSGLRIKGHSLIEHGRFAVFSGKLANPHFDLVNTANLPSMG